MKCKCIEKVNKQLANMGVELETAFEMDFDTGKASVAGPFLSVRWIDKKPRGKHLPPVLCAFCPICGKKQNTKR